MWVNSGVVGTVKLQTMHRTYKPILPTHSKLLQKRWDTAYYDEHRRRLASATPTIDTRPPRTYMHMHLKLKRLQVDEERLAVIERDNRILVEKMSKIMKTQGGVDNQNPYEYKSLNHEKRLRELLQVTKGNERIVKRISSKKPLYDHAQWDRDWITNQQYMDQISAYPREWWKQENQSRASTARSKRRSKSATTTQRSRDKSPASRTESKMSKEPKRKESTSDGDTPRPKATSSGQKTVDNDNTKQKSTKNREESNVGQSESAKKYWNPNLT